MAATGWDVVVGGDVARDPNERAPAAISCSSADLGEIFEDEDEDEDQG